MKNKLNNMGVGALSLVAAFLASPAYSTTGSAELKVTGRITPGSCSIALANSGDIDYGKITLDQAPISDTYYVGNKLLSNAVTVSCEGATLIGVNILDNRASSVYQNTGYIVLNYFSGDGSYSGGPVTEPLGLGMTEDGLKIGLYGASFTGLSVDGETSDAQFSACTAEDKLTAAVVEDGGAMRVLACPSGQSHLVVDAAGNAKSGKLFVWDYRSSVYVATETLEKGFELDGSVTMQINYL